MRGAARRAGAWAVARGSRLSLRARLLLGLVVVAAAGFVVADFVIYGQIESYLNSQADSQANAELSAIDVGFIQYNPIDHSVTLPPNHPLPAINYVEVTDLNGNFKASTEGERLQLVVPQSVIAEVQAADSAAPVEFTTTPTNSSGQYRASARLGQVTTGGEVIEVVALPLSGLEGTLHQLIVVDLAASAAVLALLAALGYLVVRIGLRPLAEMEETARTIAAGDLTRRVERDDDTTEVGRLGHSLNEMLSQIEHAFEEQQSSERRLRQFLADASHELRTPVTSIRGYAELFRRGAASRPEDLARSMRRIEDEAVRMGVLVEDLLLLARLDEGRPFERERVDLTGIVADAAADAQARAPERVITVDANGALSVEGDEQRLRQVVTNLLQNALRYTPPTTPIELRTERFGGFAVLKVIDHGEGIGPDHAPRIFERFYRADASRARESGGAGLGLAIVASITSAHGGRYRVETTPGGGATFVIELPLAPDSGAAEAESGTRDAVSAGSDGASEAVTGTRP